MAKQNIKKPASNAFPIDWKQIEKYLQAQCDGVTIAKKLGLNHHTLYRRCKQDLGITFQEFSAQKRAEGQDLLRVKMYEQAMNGNVTMQIWLGKQYLGHRERVEQDIVQQTEVSIMGAEIRIVPKPPKT